MSWSLKVYNGDLALKGTTFDTVTQEAKLAQDFRHFILERMGTDPMHPWYGSLLDGGQRNGVEVPSLVATTDWRFAKLEIESDIRRMASMYQSMQVKRAQRDRNRYGKSTLTRGELLFGISRMQFVAKEDALYVTIGLVTGSGAQTDFQLTLDPVLAWL